MFSPYVLENCSRQIQFLCEDLQNIYIYSEREGLCCESNIVGRNESEKSITNYAWFAVIGLQVSSFGVPVCFKRKTKLIINTYFKYMYHFIENQSYNSLKLVNGWNNVASVQADFIFLQKGVISAIESR